MYWYSIRILRWHIRCGLISCKKPSVGEACRSGGGFEENRRTIQPLPSPLRLFNRGRRSHVGKGAGIFPQSFKPWWKYDFTNNEAVTGLFCNVWYWCLLEDLSWNQADGKWHLVSKKRKKYICVSNSSELNFGCLWCDLLFLVVVLLIVFCFFCDQHLQTTSSTIGHWYFHHMCVCGPCSMFAIFCLSLFCCS